MSLSREHKFAPYDYGQCFVTYWYESGLVPLACGHPDREDTPQAIVRTSAPHSGRHVVFSLARNGAVPVMPPLEPADENEVLIRAVVRVAWPSYDAGGVQTLRTEGTYEFAHKSAVVPGVSDMPVGRGPYDDLDPHNFYVTPDWFDTRPLVGGISRDYPGGGRTPELQEGIQ